MSEEIKRNRWRPFLRQLNSANRYHSTSITTAPVSDSKTEKNGREFTIDQFIGITIRKHNGRINALEIAQATPNPEKIAQPIAIIDQPANIKVKKTKLGTVTQIIIADKVGNSTILKFSATEDKASTTQLVEKLAYAIFERRGSEPGHHNDDWCEAEKKIRQVEAEILK